MLNNRVIEELIITQRVGPTDSTTYDDVLLQTFAQELLKQNERFDEFIKILFTVELVIPGLYVTFLQLSHGISLVCPILALLCWVIAFGLILVSFFPKTYRVMSTVVRWQTVHNATDSLSVEEYYSRCLKDKRHFIVSSALAFFSGIFFVGFSVLVRAT